VFIVELTTREGKVCEGHATYEEARRRVEQFPAEALVGIPLIFEELPDGSQRLVREDGKPLQWHRLPADRDVQGPDEPVPLSEGLPELEGRPGVIRTVTREDEDGRAEEGPERAGR
jgi:hypothetical protein